MILDSYGVPIAKQHTQRSSGSRVTPFAGQWARAGDLASRASAASLNFTSAMTVQFWIYPFSADLVNFPVPLCKGNINTAYLLLLTSSTGKITFRVVIGAVLKDAQDATAVTRNAWNSFMGTYDGANVKLYRAGSSTAVATTAATGNIDTNANPLRVGDGDTSGNNPLNGLLYDVRLFNVARTGAQYAADYNSQISASTSGLVANWMFDEGIGPTATDRTSNALNLAVANSDQWSNIALPY